MRSLLMSALLTFQMVPLRADEGDSKVLAVPSEKAALAKTLVRQLDDDDVDVRERASAELAKLGRLALRVMSEARDKSPSQEVAIRLDRLLPTARKADFEAHYPIFLADKTGRYEHGFAGWNELKAAAKDTPESRKLFRAILSSDESRGVILSAFDSSKVGRDKFMKRWEVKNVEWRDAGRVLPNAKLKGDEPITFLCAGLIADVLFKEDYHTYFRHPCFPVYMNTAEGELAKAGKGAYGDTVIKLARYWIDQQAGTNGLIEAEVLCREMKFEEALRVQSLERLVDLAVRWGGMAYLGRLTETENPKYIATFKKFFTNSDILYKSPTNPDKPPIIQMRDSALAMCVVLSGQDSKEYGFSVQTAPTPANKLKFWDINYHFKADKTQSAEEKRTAAFKKWAEWEKANPPADKK